MTHSGSAPEGATLRASDPALRPSVCEVLEQLHDHLQTQSETTTQLRRVLKDVRDGLDADATFFHPGGSAEPFQMDGPSAVSPAWCRAFTGWVLAQSPGIDKELVRSTFPPMPPELQDLVPHSVAMVRLSKSLSSWVVALSLRPQRRFGAADVRFMSLVRKLLLAQRQHDRARQQWSSTQYGLVHCLSAAIDARDPYTHGHSQRVAGMAVRLGHELKLSGNALSDLYLAGLLHDLGKIAVRDELFLTPGPPTSDAMARIQEHAALGDQILARVPAFAYLRPAVRAHHERYDGTGYPDRLAGDQIPPLARVLAVADSVDAMLTGRPDRPPVPPLRIAATLAAGAGGQWDPKIVRAFEACAADLFAIHKTGQGESILQPIHDPPSKGYSS